ncbi:LysM peptidoglycan-binding domain-containing protein [Domibacillus sp. PGB-M46]|uniref:LysM peptidoglycan-binding domain-containing protein n=1 Tax=Domibacillus sp. PGB-M46 TaxID=2910255 RepID=UPI001F573D10|nr:LysM peptidoglycan-binding domain-containing protein [Domibacillus sp. PGB-M46]MCI2256344.1 LysM peptidoglycan-binding domain-containing protein [Domibacillus sp. PGB-M46]
MQRFYTVRPGDTLYQLARRWQLPLESLIAASHLKAPYTIYVGQQLSVPPGVDTIRVEPGDTVFGIAQFFGVPQSLIIEANQLRPPYTIQVGQLLQVPQGAPYYVVQPGDTLFDIARRFNVVTGGRINIELIRKANHLPSDRLLPGIKLFIPYAPPGDGGFIAYTSNRGGMYDIWLYNLTNGENVQLTTGLGESFSAPFWSPDSSKIAFVGKNNILYIIHLMERTVSRIDQLEEGLGSYLNWSPDSQTLAYTNQNQIILYSLSTHQPQKIKEPGATDVQWFADGTELLFQAPDASGTSQLYRIRSDGSRKHQITQNTGGPLHHVRLSPNEAYVLFTTPGVSISLIYTLELSTGRIFEIKGGPLAKNYFPVWSPDSSTIAYSATAFEEAGYFSLIRTSGKQGENDRTKALSNCFATPVTWSPNGRKVAYLSGCSTEEIADEMWVVDIQHPVPIQLVKGAFITALQWSPAPRLPLTKTYTNSAYRVQFHYPSHWQKVSDGRYEGPDGFFQISAIASDEAIHEVCRNEAFHPLQPYGSAPRIIHTKIQQQEACLIFPSEDQPPEMNGQAALIVRYPKPVQIEGTTYNYFILWADQQHVNQLSTSLRFL